MRADPTTAPRARPVKPLRVGIRTESFDWGEILSGDKESLVAHPECPAAMFDGEGETWKASRTIRAPDGRKFSVSKTGRRYTMYAPFSESRLKAAADAAEGVLSEIPGPVREYVSEYVASHGMHSLKHWFNDSAWLRQARVTPRSRRLVLEAIEVFGLAETERSLTLRSTMFEASEVIAHARSIGAQDGADNAETID